MTEKCIGNWDQDIKTDAGKPQMGFLLEFPHAMEAMARVSELGAGRYGKGTWPRVEPERYLHAFMRHSLEMGPDGNAYDEDSGLPHQWHALWNLAALIELEARKKLENSGGKISE